MTIGGDEFHCPIFTSATAGDLDGDGRGDVLISAGASGSTVQCDDFSWGREFSSVFLARSLPSSGTADMGGADILVRQDLGTTFGFASASADMNGDGLADMLVSDPDLEDYAGVTYLFYSAW